MREDFVFLTLERTRTRLVKLVENCPVEKRNEVPAGFKNSVLWHLGHVLVVTDNIVYGISERGKKLPESYKAFFGNGTKPADWISEPPAWETLVAQLEQQLALIKSDFAGAMAQPVNENFSKAETVDELLLYAGNHESNHLGNINAMIKVLAV